MSLLKEPHIRSWLLIVLLTLIVDQVTKCLILINYTMNKTVELIPGVNFHLSFNRGAAFGLLDEAGGWQRWLFIGIAIAVSTVLYVWSVRLAKDKVLERVGLACVLGGALGNLYDRIRYGYVIDFIDLYIGNWHWYTFNVADIAICAGAAFLIIANFYPLKKIN